MEKMSEQVIDPKQLLSTLPDEAISTTEKAKPVGPFAFEGTVVAGFKRGSKLLGFPTANLNEEAFGTSLDEHTTGVYFGWVTIDGGPTYKALTSIGYNPYFKNEKRTVETYVVHTFPEDFYGATMRLVIVGYLRPETDFPSMESLIAAIQNDVDVGCELLDQEPYVQHKAHDLFQDN